MDYTEHKGWVSALQVVVFPQDEILTVKQKIFSSDDEELDNTYIVSMTKETPTIDFVCSSKEEADALEYFLNKSKKVVSLNIISKTYM